MTSIFSVLQFMKPSVLQFMKPLVKEIDGSYGV